MESVQVKKVTRKGEVSWMFIITVAKKELTCSALYKSERSAQRAGENFVKRYISVK